MGTNAEEVNNAAAEKLLFYAAQIYCAKVAGGLSEVHNNTTLLSSSIKEAEEMFKAVAEKIQQRS